MIGTVKVGNVYSIKRTVTQKEFETMQSLLKDFYPSAKTLPTSKAIMQTITGSVMSAVLANEVAQDVYVGYYMEQVLDFKEDIKVDQEFEAKVVPVKITPKGKMQSDTKIFVAGKEGKQKEVLNGQATVLMSKQLFA